MIKLELPSACIPEPGPDRPPRGARTLALRTWGGGEGTFWQLGARIGVSWDPLPAWGAAAPPFPAYHHELESGAVAAEHFDTLLESVVEMGVGRRT